MTTYAVGDLHGCLEPLQRLLDKIHFDPCQDVLWFVGDLVNRGPQSLETLRFIRSLGNSAICVLGNHDLHLLAVAHGYRRVSSKDTLDALLNAPDKDVLLTWLAHRPLLHVDPTLNVALVHAGIYPQWSVKRAQKEARRVEAALRTDVHGVLASMYGNSPARWSKDLPNRKRMRFAINAFTRMRYCTINGALDFSFNGPPVLAPDNLLPWYQVADRNPVKHEIIFGHWSSHPAISMPGIHPTDRGCVWQGCLSAFAIETRTTVTVPCYDTALTHSRLQDSVA